MKTRLSTCMTYLQEVEDKILKIRCHPSDELRGSELVVLTEALSFIQQAIAAVSRAEKELADVPEKVVRLQSSSDDAS
jgi:exonuclease VII small subunit